MTGDNADRGCRWNGDDQPKEAKQLPERKQRKHKPDRVKPDRFPDELGREDVTLKELTRSNHAERQQKEFKAWPTLKQGDAQRKHQRGQGTDIRHETQKAANHANQKTVVETDQSQADAVPNP